jgi:predicted nuclease of predicted toxin-antitoxin system
LAGADDRKIFAAASAEGRVLVTLDYDFAQLLRFPPRQAAGIAVLELGRPASLPALLDRLRVLLKNLESHSVAGQLWIVEPGRVRIHLDPDDADDAG